MAALRVIPTWSVMRAWLNGEAAFHVWRQCSIPIIQNIKEYLKRFPHFIDCVTKAKKRLV